MEGLAIGRIRNAYRRLCNHENYDIARKAMSSLERFEFDYDMVRGFVDCSVSEAALGINNLLEQLLDSERVIIKNIVLGRV